MSTHFDFTIPTPCHEDWNKMTPQDQGRFCAACKKCVFDLSGKSKNEIKDLYVAAGGDLCGRIPANQLAPAPKARKIPLQTVLAHVHQAGWGQLRRFAFAVLLAFGLSQTGWAQTTPVDSLPQPVELIAGGITMVDYRHVTKPAKAEEVTIAGTVIGVEGIHLADATVELTTSKGKHHTTTTDAQGNFSFVVKTTEAYTLTARRDGKTEEWQDLELISTDMEGRPFYDHTLFIATADGIGATPPAVETEISGVVYNEDGTPADRVEVLVEAESGILKIVKTDRKGRYTMKVTTAEEIQVYPRRGDETGTIRTVMVGMKAGKHDYDLDFFPRIIECLEDDYERDMQPETQLIIEDEAHQTIWILADTNSAAYRDLLASIDHILAQDSTATDAIAPVHPSTQPEPADTESEPFEPADDSQDPTSPIAITVFPNPTGGKASLRATVRGETRLAVQVIGLDGKVLLQLDWVALPGAELPLPTEQLAAGTYLISVRTPEGHISTERLVVE